MKSNLLVSRGHPCGVLTQAWQQEVDASLGQTDAPGQRPNVLLHEISTRHYIYIYTTTVSTSCCSKPGVCVCYIYIICKMLNTRQKPSFSRVCVVLACLGVSQVANPINSIILSDKPSGRIASYDGYRGVLPVFDDDNQYKSRGPQRVVGKYRDGAIRYLHRSSCSAFSWMHHGVFDHIMPSTSIYYLHTCMDGE